MATIEYLDGGIAKYVKNGRVVYHGPKSSYWDESLQAVQHAENQENEKSRNLAIEAAENVLADGKTDVELRALAIQQERQKEVQDFEARMNNEVRVFIAHRPGFVPCPENYQNITDAITVLLKNSGRTWPFTTSDIFQAIDAVYDDGRLVFNGEYKRLTPSMEELYAMPLEKLKELEIKSRNS